MLSSIQDGDSAYCANYEQCQYDLHNIISTGYKLKKEFESFTGTLCYRVVGYYSEENDDILNQYQTVHKDISDFLDERGLSLFNQTDASDANRIVWFGKCFIEIVNSEIKCDCSIPDGDVNKFKKM